MFLEPPVGSTVIGSGRKCRRAIKSIRSIYQNYQQTRFFVSDIDWPLNNALFGLKKIQPAGQVMMCLFPDGLGSLLVAKPNIKRKLKNFVKSVIGKLGGSPYYTHRGDIMGFAVSDRIYSLMPKAISNKTKANVITIPVIEPSIPNMNCNSCIFLGQSYDLCMPPKAHKSLCHDAAEYAKSLGYQYLYYKPHHFSTKDIEKNIFQENGFTLINDKRPIEEFFLTNQMSCVVSYNSSALVHLKMMFAEKVRCIACFGGTVIKYTNVKTGTIKELKRVFELCGVELFD